MDGLPGLAETARRIFPQADIQHCTVHKMGQTRYPVRRKDWEAIREALKAVLNAPNRETTLTILPPSGNAGRPGIPGWWHPGNGIWKRC